MRAAVTVGLLLAVGCGDPSPAPMPPFGITLNSRLHVPLTVTAGSETRQIAIASTASMVVPGGTTTVTVTGNNSLYSDGTEEVDDLGSFSVLVAANATIEFTNTFGTETYFSPYLDNKTTATANLGVLNNGSVRCIGSQGSNSAAYWGYYRLTSTTELRVYRAGSGCTGPYVYWNSAALQGAIFIPKTGVALLELDTPP